HLNEPIEELNLQIQEELTRMAEAWLIRSKTQWIKNGEKSTKYFFSRYKARKSQCAQSKIEIPETSSTENENTLTYIKNQYTKIYKEESIDFKAAEKITESLPQVLQSQNNNLVKSISQEEITQAIQDLPNNKSPGTDGLTYEFYKLTLLEIAPVLEKVFNQVL